MRTAEDDGRGRVALLDQPCDLERLAVRLRHTGDSYDVRPVPVQHAGEHRRIVALER